MDIQEEAFKELEYNDLPEEYRIVAELCGMEIAVTLIKNLGGLCINIPTPRRMNGMIGRFAKNNPAISAKKIARALDCSERHVKRQKNMN